MISPVQIFRSTGWTCKAMLRTAQANRPAHWFRYWADKRNYIRLGGGEEMIHFPLVNDWTEQTPIDPVYFYQDAWAFERILQHKPQNHVDVGSHHKLVSMLAKVVPTTMVDIRPLPLSLAGLEFQTGSIVDLPFPDSSLDSLSSVCVVEHIGLGRYGDPLDPQGSHKAAKELTRVLAPGGRLFVSLPVGNRDFTYFNAHRVFSEPSILKLFESLDLKDRQYIYGNEFVPDQRPETGVGCYEFMMPHHGDGE